MSISNRGQVTDLILPISFLTTAVCFYCISHLISSLLLSAFWAPPAHCFTLHGRMDYLLCLINPPSFLPPAQAPGHFLTGPSATPHHHQPHRPLPTSQRSIHAQTFPGAPHHPGHALGAALPLQSMRPRPPPPPSLPVSQGTNRSSSCHVHRRHTPTSASPSSPVVDPSIQEGAVRTPLQLLPPVFGTLRWEQEKGLLRTSWDWLLSS